MPHKDEIPILEHEVGLNTHDDIHGNSVYVKQYGHSSTTFKLAIVTMVIFISAFLFIFLFLIMPVFYSLNHPAGEAAPHQHDMQMPDHDKGMDMGHEHDGEHPEVKPDDHATNGHDQQPESHDMGSMSHDHGRRKKRSLSQLKDAIEQRTLNACPCLKTLPTPVDSSKLSDCLMECGKKLWLRNGSGNSQSQKSMNNPLKFE